MSNSETQSERPTTLFTRRNLLLLGVALLTLVAGYAVLVSGSASAAAVLLVLGYCVLFPLALLA
ncbi:MAG: hypothetical protein KBF28_14715 [Gemmatimonadales bacterium]|nr:hypothetical protein [Gemmatimonadota bacterium]MBP9899028.1 hypothetical protein [Gemmatimonadales bacterium]MBP9899627.1 hypothetical protein [Gemmatimonadales bacterium]